MPVINVPKVLREKLGEDGVDALLETINAAVNSVRPNLSSLATKEDLVNLEVKLTKEIAEVKTAIANVKAHNIKWSFIFWLGQMSVMLGLFYWLAGKIIK